MEENARIPRGFANPFCVSQSSYAPGMRADNKIHDSEWRVFGERVHEWRYKVAPRHDGDGGITKTVITKG